MLRTLMVLLWRHFVSRTSRLIAIITTVAELALPLGFLILMFYTRNSLLKFRPAPQTGVVLMKMTDALSVSDLYGPQRIMFFPNTAPTQTIMNAVANNLHMRITDKVPGPRAKGIYPYKDEMEALLITKNMTHDDALVIFHNMDTETMPSKLNYTIRMKENYQTHLTNAQDDGDRSMMHAPHQYFGSIYKTFLSLQWAIDSSFIQSLTGSPIKQTVKLQEFPFGKSDDEGSNPNIAVFVVTFNISFSVLFVFAKLVEKLIEERVLGIRMLMQNTGAPSTLIDVAHFVNVLPVGLFLTVAGTILLQVGENPILYNANSLMIALMFLLYFCSFMAFAFVASYVTNGLRMAEHVGWLAGLGTLAAAGLAQMAPSRFTPLTGLILHVPLIWLLKSFFLCQTDGLELTTRYAKNSESVLMAFLMLVVQTALYGLLAAYLSRVRPGPFGVAHPWNFVFKADFWSTKKVEPQEVSILDEEEEDPAESKFFEAPSKRAEIGIKIVNVSKVYGDGSKALSHVNMDVYKGEITVLLGHNGAGKTTLMNIITGMFSPTEGDVFVNGKHIVRDARSIKKDIGLCPQNNILWKDMTVLHHVMFFTLIKGVPWSKARDSALELLTELNLSSKKDARPPELSGGMKRRLQLACALAGGSGVLALDEPTSGLDVETRRELWDLLLKLRGSRTVLLSTHFMEEADALGDRAAALRAGRLRCHATPMFLKRAIGSGYRLTLQTDGPPDETELTSLVTRHATAKLTDRTLNTLGYSVAAADAARLPGLFAELEEQRAALRVVNIGVGASTLEDVFLKLCSDVDMNLMQSEVDGARPVHESSRHTGMSLARRRVWALLLRQFLYTKSRWMSILLGNYLIPFLIIGVTCWGSISNTEESDTINPVRYMSIDSYKHDWKAPYNIEASVNDDLFTKSDRFWKSEDILGDIVNGSMSGKVRYEDNLVGIEINDTDAVVYYTTGVRHAAPAALNLLSNTLAPSAPTSPTSPTISTYNHPLAGSYAAQLAGLVQPKSFGSIMMSMPVIISLIQLSCLYATSLPSTEKSSGARFAHYTTGVPRPLYWSSTLLYHFAQFCVTALPAALLLLAALDTTSTYTEPHFILAMLVLLVLGALSFFPFSYVIVLVLPSRFPVPVILFVIVSYSIFYVPMSVMSTMATLSGMPLGGDATSSFFTFIGYFIPLQHASTGATLAAVTARLNALCSLNRRLCPALPIMEPGFDHDVCCGSTGNMISYWNFHAVAPFFNMIMMAVLAVLFTVFLFFLESSIFWELWGAVTRWKYAPPPTRYNDQNAKAEEAYVDGIWPKVSRHMVGDDEMLVRNLHKRHLGCCKRVNAINGISFSIKKGECLGLLGVNGAGKSTAFRVMTGDGCPTRGDLYCGGAVLAEQRNKYISQIGYCPQADGHDAFLTGRQNVALVLRLRGLAEEDVRRMGAAWMQAIGLERYMDKPVSRYSGGCARRLACAVALCTEAGVTLLDEPSAGVDPAARRRMWAALPRDRALLVTSHSMDEMEALCDRLAILSGGEVAAFGPPAAVRAAHAAGHALLLKLTSDAQDNPEEVAKLKATVIERFTSELKDEHPNVLNFHINETMPYSVLFTQMEALKAEFSIIEDYGVSETTLEEVFIALAKEGKKTD